MERFLLDLGFSWTISKISAYLIFLLLGLLLFILIKRSKMRFAKWIALIGLLLPFSVYFAICPIYEGDFSNDFRMGKIDGELPEEKSLVVLAIAGCPYCFESIEMIATIKERTDSPKVHFIVFSSDSTSKDWYADKVNGRFSVESRPVDDELISLANGSFPAFVLREKGEAKLHIWSNDKFGAPARDYVERALR